MATWHMRDDPHNPWFEVMEGERRVANVDRRKDAEQIARDHNEAERLRDELDFQMKNAANAHDSRTYQQRRAADALELLAQAVAEEAHSLTCKVVANGRHPDACDCCMEQVRAMVANGGSLEK